MEEKKKSKNKMNLYVSFHVNYNDLSNSRVFVLFFYSKDKSPFLNVCNMSNKRHMLLITNGRSHFTDNISSSLLAVVGVLAIISTGLSRWSQ